MRSGRMAWLMVVAALLLPAAAFAQDTASDPELDRVRDHLVKSISGLKREDIQRSGGTGLIEVHANHAFGYVTADGRYLISGDLTDLATGEHITDRHRNQDRLNTVLALDAIEFPASVPTQWITVFTDFDCEYCRLMHHEVPALNKKGISVRYVFFSKYGPPSKAFDKARIVWCQDNRQAALNLGLLTGVVPARSAPCVDTVKAQYDAAVDLGIQGTPAVVMPDGSLMYGYAKSDAIISEIHTRAQAQAKIAAAAPATAPVVPASDP